MRVATGCKTSDEIENLKVVGISHFLVSRDPGDVLVTYSLGSCLGVSVYDPQARIGGLIHCMLPISKGAQDKARERPAMFVDTGIVTLLNVMFELGASKERLIVKVAGAASPMDKSGRFRIGERNYAILRKVLWKNELMIRAEDIGGTAPRTVKLFMGSGRTSVKSTGGEVDL